LTREGGVFQAEMRLDIPRAFRMKKWGNSGWEGPQLPPGAGHGGGHSLNQTTRKTRLGIAATSTAVGEFRRRDFSSPFQEAIAPMDEQLKTRVCLALIAFGLTVIVYQLIFNMRLITGAQFTVLKLILGLVIGVVVGGATYVVAQFTQK
jgi:hypothetical protein